MNADSLPQLQPLTLGQIFDRAIRLYRRNFAYFVGIVAIVQVPLVALQLLIALAPMNRNSDPFAIAGFGVFGTLFLYFLSFILVQGIGTAAMTRSVADNYLGEKTGAVEAYRKIGRSWLSLIGALLVCILLGIGLLLWWLVPCIGWLTGLGMMGFLSFVVVPLVAPTVVLELKSASSAWRRAWDLARRRFWWVLGFFFVLFLFNQLVVTGPTILLSLILEAIFFSTAGSVDPFTVFAIQSAIQAIATLLLGLIFVPFQLASITLMYFDLRVRTEAFDLALLVESGSDSLAKTTLVTAEAPDAGQGSLVTQRELGYFVLLSLVPIALFGVMLVFTFLLGLLISLPAA
jgi:hypothetical protein